MTLELGRSLLMSGALSSEKLADALLAVIQKGIPLARALVHSGAIDEETLEDELARSQPDPVQLVVPARDLMERLPAGLCDRLAAAPVRLDPRSGEVLVAVLDARDTHAAEEIGYHLQMPARAIRATYASLREALEGYPLGARSLAPPMGSPPTSREEDPPTVSRPHGPPSLPNQAIELIRRVSDAPRTKIVSGAPPPIAFALPPVPDAIPSLDDADVRFATRVWDNPEAPVSAEEAYWDIEPVFELRSLAPPPTEPEPEPVTMRLRASEMPPAMSSGISGPWRDAPVATNAPAPPYADAGTVLSTVRAAESRDALLGLVQAAVRGVARRVALLVVRKDGVAGWSCTPEFGDEAAMKALRIPLEAPNMLSAVLSESVHLGPLLGSLAGPLLRVMGKASRDVAIAAIRVGDRAAVLIVADELGDTLLATKRIDEVARAAGDAMLRIVRAKRE